MIGHRRRRGRSALASAARGHILARQQRRVRPVRGGRVERGNQLGASWRPGANPGTCPVARIGRASPSAHPVGRQPTVDPSQRALARPSVVACPAPPEAVATPRPDRPFVASPFARASRSRRASCPSPTGRRSCRCPPRQRRAGFAVRRRPARVTPQRGGGGGRTAHRRVGACRTGCLGLATATAGSVVRVTGDGAASAASIVFLGRRGRADDVIAPAHRSALRPPRRPSRPARAVGGCACSPPTGGDPAGRRSGSSCAPVALCAAPVALCAASRRASRPPRRSSTRRAGSRAGRRSTRCRA